MEGMQDFLDGFGEFFQSLAIILIYLRLRRRRRCALEQMYGRYWKKRRVMAGHSDHVHYGNNHRSRDFYG